MTDYAAMTVVELRALAVERGLGLPIRTPKAGLVAALEAAGGANPGSGSSAAPEEPPETVALGRYRARAREQIEFHTAAGLDLVINKGGTFSTDEIPFDPVTMERIEG